MTNTYLEFREGLKKYELDKLFESDDNMQFYCDTMLSDIVTAINDIEDTSSTTIKLGIIWDC